MNKRLRSLFFVGILMLAHTAHAAEPIPGDTCTTAGSTTASNNSGVGHFMVCQGGAWKSVYSYSAAGALTKIGNLTCATNEILKFNGTNWACAADSGLTALPALASANIWVGNASSAATAVTMSGDATLSNAGALTIATGAVTSAKIADGTITGTDIANTTITVGKLSATGTAGSTTYLRGDGSWSAPAAGAAGSTGQVQYNNSGALAGDSGLTYDGAGALTVTGNVQATTFSGSGGTTSGTFNAIRGNASITGGTGYGVAGLGSSTAGTAYGVYGASSTTSGLAYGVYGIASNTGGAAYGVYAKSSLPSATYALYCDSSSANGCGGNKAWYNASDGRLKKDVTDLPLREGLSAVMRLRPVTYRWRNGSEKTEMGFIAQEVEGILPELVGQGPDTVVKNTDGTEENITDVRSLSYGSFVVPLVKAVQELKEITDRQAAEIETLRAEIKAKTP